MSKLVTFFKSLSTFTGLVSDYWITREYLMTLKVLIVDDEPSNGLLLSRLLERLGCTVSFASDGIEAELCFLNYNRISCFWM